MIPQLTYLAQSDNSISHNSTKKTEFQHPTRIYAIDRAKALDTANTLTRYYWYIFK